MSQCNKWYKLPFTTTACTFHYIVMLEAEDYVIFCTNKMICQGYKNVCNFIRLSSKKENIYNNVVVKGGIYYEADSIRMPQSLEGWG